jgi:hypothetical protein
MTIQTTPPCFTSSNEDDRALLLVTPIVYAGDISCPARWAPAGRIAEGAAVGQPFRDIGVIVGEMKPRAVLRGSERKTRGGYEVRFSGLSNYGEPVSKWAYCGYGPDARLLRRMPDTTNECVATLGKSTVTMRCK